MNRLLLLATGGTIAGCADDSATLNDYTAGVLGGDVLLAAVPQLQDLATISVEQVANVDSAEWRPRPMHAAPHRWVQEAPQPWHGSAGVGYAATTTASGGGDAARRVLITFNEAAR